MDGFLVNDGLVESGELECDVELDGEVSSGNVATLSMFSCIDRELRIGLD